jgi:hypothetical protein
MRHDVLARFPLGGSRDETFVTVQGWTYRAHVR